MCGLGELLWCRGATPRVQHRLLCRTEGKKVKGETANSVRQFQVEESEPERRSPGGVGL